MQVKNDGSGPATGVLVRDRLPAGLKHEQGGFIEAELGTLGPGETKSLSLQTTAVQAGRQVNQLVVTAEGGFQVGAEAAVLVLERAPH